MTDHLTLTLRIRHQPDMELPQPGSTHPLAEGALNITSCQSAATNNSVAGEIATTILTEVIGPTTTGVVAAWLYDRFLKRSPETAMSIDPSELVLTTEAELADVLNELLEQQRPTGDDGSGER